MDIKLAYAILNSEDRESILYWLKWNDRNGAYTDSDCDLEELPRLNLEEAKSLMSSVIMEIF
jgi:hypothetical protein